MNRTARTRVTFGRAASPEGVARANISGLALEGVPDARPMFGDVLVKVAACGVSGVVAALPSRDDIRTVFIQESSRAQLAELARLVGDGQPGC
jgi:hypothetical protein